MSKTAHFLFISLLILVVLITFMFLFINGLNYYKTDLGERFYHPLHESLKPSGSVGHGLGIVGSFLMITGMGTYMARKRYRIFSRLGLLKHWLEVHIFLCTLGPLLIIFHTALKFGGLVAISFWSMVAVFMSGIIVRFIYIQIPHTKEGRELTQNEIREIRGDVAVTIRNNYNLNEECFSLISNSVKRRVGLYESNLLKSIIKSAARDRKKIREIREELIFENIPRKENPQFITQLHYKHKKNFITLVTKQ